MMNYGLSLAERKRKLIEDCVGCGGDGADMDSDIGDDTAADAVDPPKDILDKALDKLKKKKRKK